MSAAGTLRAQELVLMCSNKTSERSLAIFRAILSKLLPMELVASRNVSLFWEKSSR